MLIAGITGIGGVRKGQRHMDEQGLGRGEFKGKWQYARAIFRIVTKNRNMIALLPVPFLNLAPICWHIPIKLALVILILHLKGLA